MRFETHIRSAQAIAGYLSGGQEQVQLTWISAVPLIDDGSEMEGDEEDELEPEEGLEPIEALFEDLILQEDEDECQEPAVEVLSTEMPMTSQSNTKDKSSTSTVPWGRKVLKDVPHEGPSGPHAMAPWGPEIPMGIPLAHKGLLVPQVHWTAAMDLDVDKQMLAELKGLLKNVKAKHAECPLKVKAQRGLSYFKNSDIDRLGKALTALDDVCITGGVLLLQYVFTYLIPTLNAPAHQFAVLTSYDLALIQCDASKDEIWRSARKSEFWCKELWIIPIHRARSQHWVLCIVNIKKQEILVYDSLAGPQSSWQDDIQVSLNL